MSENTTSSTFSAVSTLDVFLSDVSTVKSVWPGLSVKERNAVKKAVQTGMAQAIQNGDLVTGQALVSVSSEIDGLTGTPVVPKVDPKVTIAQLVADLTLAAAMLRIGEMSVSGVDPVVLDEADIPDGNVENAAKLVASVKIGRKTKENDIPALIGEYFATVTPGTFKVISEIRNGIAQMYPDKGVTALWDGRLNAALFVSDWDNAEIVPVSSKSAESFEWDKKGRAGAYRVDLDNSDNGDESDEGDENDNS